MRQIVIFDNSADQKIVISPEKQTFAFFPKEESQMFKSVKNNASSSSPSTESENADANAFLARDASNRILPNSSHTPTDYIGATVFNLPTKIVENFAEFKYYDLQKSTFTNIFANTDTSTKIFDIANGLQAFKLPKNLFNANLTNQVDIVANNNSYIKKNYGSYYIMIKPKSIDCFITEINEKAHYPWQDINTNEIGSTNAPNLKRRNVYTALNTNFINTPWAFKSGSNLYGSVVEVWNNDGSVLKANKILTECDLNLSTVNGEALFVLYPDNFGIESNDISSGDILRIFPRETFFNNIIFEVLYKDIKYNLENILAYTLNEAVRDLETGVIEIFDESGFSMNENGIVNGNVVQRYQLVTTDKYELRKRII